MTGTELITSNEVNYSATTGKRTFDEVMSEAKTLWNDIIKTQGDAGREKIHNVIVGVFKHDMQLSKATQEQQDLVELVIEDFKKLM